MVAAFAFLFMALLAKDILPLGDRYILRGVGEGIALAVGVGWLVSHQVDGLVKRYAVVLCYLGILAATAIVSRRPLFVILQVLSLGAVMLFFIAYVESSQRDRDLSRRNLVTMGYACCLACGGSLLLLAAKPQMAFELTPEGNRFRGLFNEPAMMGAVSGLLIGLAAFGRVGWLIRIGGALSAVPCVYFTGSRTSWGAAIAALLLTGSLYLRQRRAWIVALAFVGALGGLGLVILDMRLAPDVPSRVLRSGSIDTLSGRTALWGLALQKYKESPILGYGFTTGSDALITDMGDTLSTAFGVTDRAHAKAFSLHSGYVQALLDSGAVGASLYLSVLTLSLWRLFRHDRERLRGAEMYCLVFFCISNLADTIIFGAAVFYEVFFWYVAVLAMGTVGSAREPSTETARLAIEGHMTWPLGQPVRAIDEPVLVAGARRYPLLQD
jgi:hypothetical protein